MARSFYIEDNVAPPSISFELTAPSGFTEITDEATLQSLYEGKYNDRTEDGANYYNEFRTAVYLKILNETYTPTEAFLLEIHVKDLKEELTTGNWLTAQNVNTNLALSGIYTQAMKDELQSTIDAYVTNEY